MASDQLSSFQLAVESLTLFEEQYEDVELLAVLLNEDYDARGSLFDVVDITFRIRGRAGMFSVHPPFDIDWVAQANFAIGEKHAYVEGIYQGLASKNDLPAGAAGPPRPAIGPVVPV